jgi:hypothetical protein
VDAFVESMRAQFIFILAKGDLETYLPLGYRAKDLDKLIRLVSSEFWPELPEFARAELTTIVEQIKLL